jgi:hypothetical protein
MTVVISQSMYFPWPGLLEQVREADVFVHYDDVQYTRGFLNRVQVKTREGIRWLTVPLKDLKRGQLISEVHIDEESDWRNRHRSLLRHSYARTPHVAEMLGLFDNVLSNSISSLADLTRASIRVLADYFGFSQKCRFVDSRDLGVGGAGSERILDTVLALEGTVYVTGHGGRNYLDHEEFDRAGVEVRYMNYRIAPYAQVYGVFTPFVSSLDLIAHCGREGSAFMTSGTLNWKEPTV